jgi:uncharacterized HAD superfamily protein
MRKTIAVDVDDVLARSAEGFVSFSNEQWGSQMTVDDYTEAWDVAWRVDIDEAIARAKIFLTSGVFGTFKYDETALPVLAHLQKRYNLIVVTSRRKILKPQTNEWLDRHFPGIFSGVHFVGIWDDATKDDAHTRLKQTKADMCRELGAEYLIDDQPKHCVAVAEAGLEALLFGTYAWNRHGSLPRAVTRVPNWTAVQEYFDAKS